MAHIYKKESYVSAALKAAIKENDDISATEMLASIDDIEPQNFTAYDVFNYNKKTLIYALISPNININTMAFKYTSLLSIQSLILNFNCKIFERLLDLFWDELQINYDFMVLFPSSISRPPILLSLSSLTPSLCDYKERNYKEGTYKEGKYKYEKDGTVKTKISSFKYVLDNFNLVLSKALEKNEISRINPKELVECYGSNGSDFLFFSALIKFLKQNKIQIEHPDTKYFAKGNFHYFEEIYLDRHFYL